MVDAETELLDSIFDVAAATKCSILDLELARLEPTASPLSGRDAVRGLRPISGNIVRWGIDDHANDSIKRRLQEYGRDYPSFLLFDDFFTATDPFVYQLYEGTVIAEPSRPLITAKEPISMKWHEAWDARRDEPAQFLNDAWMTWSHITRNKWEDRSDHSVSCLAIGARFLSLNGRQARSLEPLDHSAAIFATIEHDDRRTPRRFYYESQVKLLTYLGSQLLDKLEQKQAEAEKAHLHTKQLLEEERAQFQLTTEVRDDLDRLLVSVASARDSALRIEGKMDRSRQSFLRLYGELRLIFLPDSEICYRTEGDRIVIERAQDKTPDNAIRMRTIHSSSSRDLPELWEQYVKLLHQYEKNVRIDLLRWFNTKDKQTFTRQFELLKILVQRPHLRKSGLFPMQLLVGSLLAVQQHFSPVTVQAVSVPGDIVFTFNKKEDANYDNLVNLLIADDRCAPWLSSESPERGGINKGEPPSRTLGALMNLIGNELRSSTGVDKTVVVKSVSIQETQDSLHVFIVGDKAFPEAEKLRDLSDAADRSLRGALRSLCDSVGQEQLLLIKTIDPQEIRSFRSRLRHPHGVILGLTDEQAVFSVSWPREQH